MQLLFKLSAAVWVSQQAEGFPREVLASLRPADKEEEEEGRSWALWGATHPAKGKMEKQRGPRRSPGGLPGRGGPGQNGVGRSAKSKKEAALHTGQERFPRISQANKNKGEEY